MRRGTVLTVILAITVSFLSGCEAFSPEESFFDVAGIVDERTGHSVVWDQAGPDDLAVRASVTQMLGRPISEASAVQIALLNNREIQSFYADLGIAQAALFQAGLLNNPVFDGAISWYTDAGGTPNFAFGVVWNFIDLLHRPMRQAVAASELEEAKLRVAGRVIEHASNTREAFFSYVAVRQEVSLLQDVVRSSRATITAAEALRRAGNITELQFERRQNVLTRAKLELAMAESQTSEAREKLNVLMGLTGAQTEWRAPTKLPNLPRSEFNTSAIERRAVERSLDLGIARQRLVTLGNRFRLVRAVSLFPDLGLGPEVEREIEVEEGIKNPRTAPGFTFDMQIPIFDHGQARKAGVEMQIAKAEADLWALAVRVRSVSRLTRARLLTARKSTIYYREAVIPQADRVLLGTQRDYNAMQESVFELILAKRQQIQSKRQYIQSLKSYWTARIRFEKLLSGKLPDGAAGAVEVAAADGGDDESGGH